MLRFVLLVALPLVVFCGSPANELREQTIRYYEDHIKPCILFKRNCPSDGSLSLLVLEQTVRQLKSYSLPKQCDCDTSQSSCLRPCYYAFIQKQMQAGIDAGHVNMTDSAVQQQLEIYRACLLENKGCEVIPGGLNLIQLAQQVETLRKFYTLPKACECDLTRERCIRICYYTYTLQTALANKRTV